MNKIKSFFTVEFRTVGQNWQRLAEYADRSVAVEVMDAAIEDDKWLSGNDGREYRVGVAWH